MTENQTGEIAGGAKNKKTEIREGLKKGTGVISSPLKDRTHSTPIRSAANSLTNARHMNVADRASREMTPVPFSATLLRHELHGARLAIRIAERRRAACAAEM